MPEKVFDLETAKMERIIYSVHSTMSAEWD